MESCNEEEFLKYLNALPFLRVRIRYSFELIGTPYIFYANLDVVDRFWGIKSDGGTNVTTITFEEVFENSPSDVKDQLLFHLDLFR